MQFNITYIDLFDLKLEKINAYGFNANDKEFGYDRLVIFDEKDLKLKTNFIISSTPSI